MSLLKAFKRFVGSQEASVSSTQSVKEDKEEAAPNAEVKSPPPPVPVPKPRTVIRAPVIKEDLVEAQGNEGSPDPEGIEIKAQPQQAFDECLFLLSQPLFEGHSWCFDSKESAQGSPLGEALFSHPEVESALVCGSTLTITSQEKQVHDWKPLARKIGASVRKVIKSQEPLIDPQIVTQIPSEEELRSKIQEVLDQEINPGVASHGGVITLERMVGNTAYIKMGGGCHGCSSAAVTLKAGVVRSFREQVPFIGAVIDETDHTTGENPYFT